MHFFNTFLLVAREYNRWELCQRQVDHGPPGRDGRNGVLGDPGNQGPNGEKGLPVRAA
ncbi:hypothetical protein X798_07271, partial [Onchocerca flexuosa]